MQNFSNLTCQNCPHQKTPLLGCCTSDELEQLSSQKSTHIYQKGQTIYQQGNKVLGLHCVHQGKIKLTRVGGDQREHIVHLAKPGEVIGYRALLAGSRYTTSAVALDACVVCFVPRLDFIGLLQSNKQFSNALLHMLANALGQAEDQLLHLAHKPVRERLAGALVALQQTYGNAETGGEHFSIALTREDVAALVGTAKETVSRLLSEFKELGLIATRGSLITVLNPERLAAIASQYD
ncbi:Crp/Fnr family transcriptional regulator [Hymenobacter sp. RP-2-7]|uniref:Crp/Fnr family transcriptional regulator n=1 Tax=Hymenobacter polaris TaxID=2682546 RepID=A0A7Y0FME6_9BACT|nr:Crp/Fnr family transcriptional regulator [Hymenobacter polaris]NML65757.1 Crp/Fnr family transcriptional regulator [Hymenobacter polaris]